MYYPNEKMFAEIKQRAEQIRQKVEDHDQYTFQHSVRVSHWAVMMASRIPGFDYQRLLKLEITALLHDYGKTFIKPEILRKEGPLNDEEWAQMKLHPELGVRNLPVPREFVEEGGILWHHKAFNGGGYPNSKLMGYEIPLEARLIACADVFDALTSVRLYRRGKKVFEPSEAMLILRNSAGVQLDPAVVAVFDSIYKMHCEKVGGQIGRKTMQVLSIVGAEIERARDLLSDVIGGAFDFKNPLKGREDKSQTILRNLTYRLARTNLDLASAENVARHILKLELRETFKPEDIVGRADTQDSGFDPNRHTTEVVLQLKQLPANLHYMSIVVYQGELWLSILERKEGHIKVRLLK